MRTHLLPALLVILSACSARDKDPGDTDTADDTDSGIVDTDAPRIALADFCQEGSEGYHAWLRNCYGEDAYPDDRRDAYIERIASRCLHAEGAVAAGRLTYDPVQAAECLASYQTDHCIGSFWPSLCDTVFHGEVPLGESCYPEESLVFLVGVETCEDGWCDDDGACPGTCAPYAGKGESCADATCEPGLGCGSENLCIEPLPEGASCEAGFCEEGTTCMGDPRTCTALVQDISETCSDELVCGPPNMCVDGTCVSHSDLGGPCTAPFQCRDGAHCAFAEEDDAFGACTAPVGAGEACEFDAWCEDGLYCADRDTDDPTCKALPAEGETCELDRCVEGTSCRRGPDDTVDAGSCRKQVTTGESCLVDGERDLQRCADDLFCTTQGTCEPAGSAAGAPCAPTLPGACEGDLWCAPDSGTCQPPGTKGTPCSVGWPTTCGEGLACDCGAEDAEACIDFGYGFADQVKPDDTCQPLLDAGAPCFRHAECSSANCQFEEGAATDEAGVCLPPSECLP